MGITLDGSLAWLWDKLVLGTSFQHWPDGDPDAWRELGDAWLELHEAITEAFNEMNPSATNVALSWGGDAGQAFAERWSDFVNSDDSGPAAFAIAAYDYYGACSSGALQLEYSQLMCQIIVVVTAIEVAIGLAFAEFGGEAFSAAAVATGRIALRAVLEKLATAAGRQALKQALKKASKLAAKKLAFAAVKGGLTFGGADLLAQQIQIGEGYRSGFDWKSIGVTTAGGAAAGLGGQVFGSALRGGGRVLGNKLLGNKLLGGALKPLLRDEGAGALRGAARWGLATAGRLTQAGLVNIPTMAAMDLAQNAVRTGQFGFSKEYLKYFDKKGVLGELGDQFIGGAFAAVVHGGLNTAGRGLFKGGEWVAGRFHELAVGQSRSSPTLGRDPWLSNAEGWTGARGEALTSASSALAKAHSYRELEVAARREAAGLTGAERRDALNQAHEYESLAGQADARATTAQHEADTLSRSADVGQPPRVRVDSAGARSGGDQSRAGGSAEQPRAGGIRVPGAESARVREEHAPVDRVEATSETVETTGGTQEGRQIVGGTTTGTAARPTGRAETLQPDTGRQVPTSANETNADGTAGPTRGAGDTAPDGIRLTETSADHTTRTTDADTSTTRDTSGTAGSRRVPDEVDPRSLDEAAAAAASAPIPMALDGLRTAHHDHIQAEQRADFARQSAEDARRTATQHELDKRRLGRSASRRPDAAEHGLQDSVLWRERSAASHEDVMRGQADVMRRLDDLLRRPDLPESARPKLERMREAYLEAANERALADDHSARIPEIRAEAGEFRGSGDRDNALKSAERSGDAAGEEARRRMASVRALARADEALRGVPEVRVEERAPESSESSDRPSGGSHRVPERGREEHGPEPRGTEERAAVGLSPDGDGRPGDSAPVPPQQREGRPAEPSGAGASHAFQEEQALDGPFGSPDRTGAGLPNDVRALVEGARERLLERYPGHTVNALVQDLGRIAEHADRVDEAVRLVREGGGLRGLVDRVRELSQAVNEYGDRYRGWQDPSTGERAEPGWLDLHGVDPLDPAGAARRITTIDPVTKRLHPIDRAVAVAKIEDVLGPEWGDYAVRVFDRVVPKDIDAVNALVPDKLRSQLVPDTLRSQLDEKLNVFIRSGYKGGLVSRIGLIFVEPGRAITAVAATVVHEGLHFLQPNQDAVTRAVQDAIGRDPALSPEEKVQADRRARALMAVEGEYEAFILQQHFLRGLAGFDVRSEYTTDPRVPDEYGDFPASSSAWLREEIPRKCIGGKLEFRSVTAEELFGTRDPLSQYAELTDIGRLVERADRAIGDSVYDGNDGRLVGPITKSVVDEYNIDLEQIQVDQARQRPPELRDMTEHRTDSATDAAGERRPGLVEDQGHDHTPTPGDTRDAGVAAWEGGTTWAGETPFGAFPKEQALGGPSDVRLQNLVRDARSFVNGADELAGLRQQRPEALARRHAAWDRAKKLAHSDPARAEALDEMAQRSEALRDLDARIRRLETNLDGHRERISDTLGDLRGSLRQSSGPPARLAADAVEEAAQRFEDVSRFDGEAVQHENVARIGLLAEQSGGGNTRWARESRDRQLAAARAARDGMRQALDELTNAADRADQHLARLTEVGSRGSGAGEGAPGSAAASGGSRGAGGSGSGSGTEGVSSGVLEGEGSGSGEASSAGEGVSGGEGLGVGEGARGSEAVAGESRRSGAESAPLAALEGEGSGSGTEGASSEGEASSAGEALSAGEGVSGAEGLGVGEGASGSEAARGDLFDDGLAERADVADSARRMLSQLQGPPESSPFKLVAPDPQPQEANRVHVTTWNGREFTVKVFIDRLPEDITHKVTLGRDGSVEIALPDRIEVGSRAGLDLATHESLGRALVDGLKLVDQPASKGQTLDWLRRQFRPKGSALDANRLPDGLPIRAGQARDWFRGWGPGTRELLHLPESTPEQYHSTLPYDDLIKIHHLRVALDRYLKAHDALVELPADAPGRIAAERELATTDRVVRAWVSEYVADAPRDRSGRLRDADLDRQQRRHLQLRLVTDRLPPEMADVVRERWRDQAGEAAALRQRPALAGAAERSAPGEVPSELPGEASAEGSGEHGPAQAGTAPEAATGPATRARYKPPTRVALARARSAIETAFGVVVGPSERAGQFRAAEWVRDPDSGAVSDRLLSVTTHDGRQRIINTSNIIDELAPRIVGHGEVEAVVRLGRRLDAEFQLHPDEPGVGGLDALAQLHQRVPAGAKALVEARFDAELRDLRVHGDRAARDRLTRSLSPAAWFLLDRLYRDTPLDSAGPFAGREWMEPPNGTAQSVPEEIRAALPDVFAALAGPKETHLLASVRLADDGHVVGITHDGRKLSVPVPRVNPDRAVTGEHLERIRPIVADALAIGLSDQMLDGRSATPTSVQLGANRLRVLSQLHEFSSGEQRAAVGARIRDLITELGLRADQPEARQIRPQFNRLLSSFGYELITLKHFGAEPHGFEVSHLPEERSHALAAVARTLHRLGSGGTKLVHELYLVDSDRVVVRTKGWGTFDVKIPERLYLDLSAYAGRDLAEVRALEDRHALVVMGEQIGVGLDRLIADGHQPRRIGEHRLGGRTLSPEQRQALSHVGGMHGYGAVREHLLEQAAAARYAGDTAKSEALRRELDAVEGELRQYAQQHGLTHEALDRSRADRDLFRMVPSDVRAVLDRPAEAGPAPHVGTEAPRPSSPESATLQEISQRNGGLYPNEAQVLREVREIAPLITGEGQHELARSLRLDADATLVAQLHNGRTVQVPLLDKIPLDLPADAAARRVEVTKVVARAVAEAKMEQANPHRWLRRHRRGEVLRLDPDPGKLKGNPGSLRDAQRIDELRALGRLDGHADVGTRSLIREALRDPRLTEGDLGTAPRREWVQQRVPEDAWRLIEEANADRPRQLTDVIRVFDRGRTHGDAIAPEMKIQADADHRVPIETVHGRDDLRLERGHSGTYRVIPNAEGRWERLHRFLLRTDPGITVEIRPGRGDGRTLIWHEAPRWGSEEAAPPGLKDARQAHPGHYVLYVETERWPGGVPHDYIDQEIGRQLAKMVADDRQRPNRLASSRSIVASNTAVQAAGVVTLGAAIADHIIEWTGGAGALLTSAAAMLVGGVATVRHLRSAIHNVDVYLRQTRYQFPDSRDSHTEFHDSIQDLRDAADSGFTHVGQETEKKPRIAESEAHRQAIDPEVQRRRHEARAALYDLLGQGSVDGALEFKKRPDVIRVYHERFAPRDAARPEAVEPGERPSGERPSGDPAHREPAGEVTQSRGRRGIGGRGPFRALRRLRPYIDIVDVLPATERTPEFERSDNAKYTIYVPVDRLPEGKTLTDVMHDRITKVMADERDFVQRFPSLKRRIKANIFGLVTGDIGLGVAVGEFSGNWAFGAVLTAAGAARRGTSLLFDHWQDRRFQAADSIAGQYDETQMRTIPADEVDAAGWETLDAAKQLVLKAGGDRTTMAVHHGLVPETSPTSQPASEALGYAADELRATGHRLAGGAIVHEVLSENRGPSGLARKFRIEQPKPLLAKTPLIGDLTTHRATDVYLVPDNLPGKAAARIVFMHPDETMIAISSHAPRAEIEYSVGVLRDVVAESLRHNNPRNFWQYFGKSGIGSGMGTASRFLIALTTGHIETSYVTLWATPFGAFGGAFAEHATGRERHWRDYMYASVPELVPDVEEVSKQYTAANMATTTRWASEQVEMKMFTAGEAARPLYDHPEYGDEVRRRWADLMEAGGITSDEARRQVLQQLLDPRATLPHDRSKTARELLGIVGVKQVDADTVRLEFRQHHWWDLGEAKGELTLHPTPMRFRDEGPAVRARTINGRLVIGIDVVAEPQRIQHDLWSEVARQLSLRDTTAPFVASRSAYVKNRLTTAATQIVGQGAGFLIGGVNAVGGIGYAEVVSGSSVAAVADGLVLSPRLDQGAENIKGRAKDFTARMTGKPSPELIIHTNERLAGAYRFDRRVDEFMNYLEQVRANIGLPAGQSLGQNHREPIPLARPEPERGIEPLPVPGEPAHGDPAHLDPQPAEPAAGEHAVRPTEPAPEVEHPAPTREAALIGLDRADELTLRDVAQDMGLTIDLVPRGTNADGVQVRVVDVRGPDGSRPSLDKLTGLLDRLADRGIYAELSVASALPAGSGLVVRFTPEGEAHVIDPGGQTSPPPDDPT